MSRRLITAYCLLAGACDASTGALLVGAPVATLKLMGIAELPAEPIYLRFIGVFVGSVGLAYLYPLLLNRDRSDRRIAVVLEVTALVRLCVAIFLGFAIARAALGSAWSTVLLTDLLLAAVQILMLTKLSSS